MFTLSSGWFLTHHNYETFLRWSLNLPHGSNHTFCCIHYCYCCHHACSCSTCSTKPDTIKRLGCSVSIFSSFSNFIRHDWSSISHLMFYLLDHLPLVSHHLCYGEYMFNYRPWLVTDISHLMLLNALPARMKPLALPSCREIPVVSKVSKAALWHWCIAPDGRWNIW